MKNSLVTIILIAAVVMIGCQDTRLMPEDMDGIYLYGDLSATYYTIDILNRTSGTINTMNGQGTSDDTTDDTTTSSDPFTITEASPWYFSGGPLDHDAGFQLGHTINVYGFDGQDPARFGWAWDD